MLSVAQRRLTVRAELRTQRFHGVAQRRLTIAGVDSQPKQRASSLLD